MLEDESISGLFWITTSLSSDVVFQFPLLNISYYASNRLVNRYSIREANGITREWYEWKQMLKKNTEIRFCFDAQPS
jgi:hypothetical protein